MKKLFLAFAAAVSLNAQTLDSFVEQVLSKNPEIATLKAQANAAKEEAKIASSLDNPMLGVQVANIDFSSPAKRDIEPMQQIMYSLTQNVPLNGKLSARENAKKVYANSIENRVEQKKLDIEFEVKKAAYELTKAKETKKIYEKYLQTLRFALDIARSSNISGEISHSELIRAEMETASFLRKLNDLDSEIRISQKTIESFGTKPSEELLIKFDMPTSKATNISLDLSKNISMIEHEQKSIQNELRAEKLSIVPDVGVTVGYASSDTKFRDYWFFGLTIPLPIYGKENASVRKKTYELSAKQDEKTEMKNKLELELESNKIKLQSAQKNYELTNKILKTQLSHLLESALASSKSSAQARPYLISTIKDALGLELELINYKFDANVALAQIKKISGQEI
ncbi:MAG: TolC family protein [Campylobacterales bacterium]|nr:TolC family protein [Campylobacterales bacterium]